jgi:hypothetical protein
MTDGFSNPITAGQGILVQPGIQSPNFSLAGQTGWAILANGNAYFFQVTTSGSVIIGGTNGWFIYNGDPEAGNSPVAYGVASGVTEDPFGNALPAADGIVSVDPVAYAQLISGGMFIALYGAIASASAASLTISGSSAGQAISLTSGQGPEAGAAETTLVLLDSGAGGAVQVISGNDGNTYDTQRLTLKTTGTQTFSTGSGQPITGLSAPVAAGTYKLRARIRFTTSAAGGNAQINFTGPATSLCELGGDWAVISSSGSNLPQAETTLGGAFTSIGLNSGGQVFTLDGIVTFSAKGTLVMQGTGAVADPWTTVAGCTLELEPVTA